MSTKFVYCLSYNRSFRKQVSNSVRTLSQFIPKEDIILIVNPPNGIERLKKIFNKYATIYEGNKFYEELDLPNFKYKIEMCDIDCDNLVFLDCDTIILKDPRELLDGDYDFFGREEPCRSIDNNMKETWNQETWETNLARFNLPLDSIPYNDGFVIFKNKTHMKIKDDFIKYYKMYNNNEIDSPNTVDDMHHNEFALSMAVSNYNCKVMDDKHHWYGWRAIPYTKSDDSYVLHVGTDKSGLQGYMYNISRHYHG